MKFSTVCWIGIVVTVPFGIAFVLSPEMTGALYGIGSWTTGTAMAGRLLGVHLLYTAAATLAVTHCDDAALQRRYAGMFCVLSALAAVIAAATALSPGMSPLLWSTVAIYAFFAVAWAWVAVSTGANATAPAAASGALS